MLKGFSLEHFCFDYGKCNWVLVGAASSRPLGTVVNQGERADDIRPYLYFLAVGFVKIQGIFVAGIICGTAKDAHDDRLAVFPENRQQAGSGFRGGAGF